MRKSYFSISTDSYAIKDVISILTAAGIDMDKLFFAKPMTFYLCRNLYVAYSFGEASYGFAFIHKFKQNVINYYNVKSMPQDYVLHKRSSKKRSIINFEEVKSYVKENFPSYNRVHFPDTFDTFEKTVKKYSLVKFYFSGTGSSMINVIFMNQNTGAVYFIFNFYDPPILLISNIFRIWTKCFKVYHHDHNRDNCLFTKELLDQLKFTIIDVMYSIRTSKWKNIDQCYNLYERARDFYNNALKIINGKIINYTFREINCTL